MKIYFHGATGDVTGSAYHVKTKTANVLVDCGLCCAANADEAIALIREHRGQWLTLQGHGAP